MAIAACSGSHGASQGAGNGTARVDLGCVQDAAAQEACGAKGSAFVYRADPPPNCPGTDPGPEAMRQEAEARRKEPCVCIEDAIAKQREAECANTP
jgi:hypothetical protein